MVYICFSADKWIIFHIFTDGNEITKKQLAMAAILSDGSRLMVYLEVHIRYKKSYILYSVMFLNVYLTIRKYTLFLLLFLSWWILPMLRLKDIGMEQLLLFVHRLMVFVVESGEEKYIFPFINNRFYIDIFKKNIFYSNLFKCNILLPKIYYGQTFNSYFTSQFL